MVYDPVNPINSIFTAINKLVHDADTTNSPYTQSEIVNMGYIILNKSGYFRCWILETGMPALLSKTLGLI